MSIVRSIALLILVSTLWAGGATAQSTSPNAIFGRYQQVNWQEREGLPQNTVLAVTTTRDGYVWVGTYEGAARFDGVRFTLFNTSNTTGIGSSFIMSLLESRNGDLWLATYGGGVSRLSGGHFTQYAMRDGLSSDYTTCLFEDESGALWIGTDGGGVNSFRQGRFSAYTVTDGLPSNLVRAIVDEGDGALVVGTSRGMARITGERVSAYEGRADVVRADIRTLARAPDGSLWVAPMTGGLYRIDDTLGITEFGPPDGLMSTVVESLLAGDDGTMWVGTATGGLFRYSAGRFDRYAPADGLPGARVAVIAHSSDKGLWIGTDGGLVRFKTPRFTTYTRRDGLGSDYIGSIFQGADGSVWVVAGSRLTRFEDGSFKVFTTNDGLRDDRVRGLARGADGLPWIYTQSGLTHWTSDGFVDLEGVSRIPWDRVTSVLEDRSGTLWVGIHDGGLMRVRDERITGITKQDGLADDSVLTLFEDRAGSVWVGTLRNGVTRISNGQLTSWSTQDGLAANHVKAFYQDAAGALWIGTHGGGLSRFKNDRFANISARQGLYNDDIFQILEDDDGNLWMNCNTGIWRTSLTQLNDVADGRRTRVESFAYGTADGMLSTEGVGGNLAGWKMRDGLLWFPTTKGVVVIDPRRRDTEPPRVVIERITIDREPMAIGRRVRLTPGQENLEIQYTGLSWSRPEAVKFRFRLIGLDRDWVDAGARRTAYYSHLPPGSYTFMVTADNGEGVWNETGQSLAVVVLPRFYQTWWFRAAAVVSLVAMLWVSWRYRIAQMKHAQAAHEAFSRQLIESQERERQRIAAELHDSLGQNLLVVKNRAMLGALSQPDEEALKQFNAISATVTQTLEEVRTISYNLRPHHLDQLGLTTTIGAMVQKMAESSGIQIISELDDIDGVFDPPDEITIYRIIQESLNNVVKHSGAREAHVRVRCTEHHVDFTIRDDGRGLTSNGSDVEVGDRGGFGLKGLAQRVDMLGGTHAIWSSPRGGTTVSVHIDLRARKQGRHGE